VTSLLRVRSLRARLILGLLTLLATACALLGLVTTLALHKFLIERLDQQLLLAGESYAVSLEHGSSRPKPSTDLDDKTPAPSPSATPSLSATPSPSGTGDGSDVPGAVGTLGGRIADGRLTVQVVPHASDDADLVSVTTSARDALFALPVDGRPRTLDLGNLGDYRVRAVKGRDGDILISGLPTRDVTIVLAQSALVESLVFALILGIAGGAGVLFVRSSLRPLQGLTNTALQVSELPLGSGEVTLPDRVAGTDPATEVGQVAAAFNQMLAHVEAALEQRQASEDRLRHFIADASHELRTPVAAIRGHAELARRVPEPVPATVERALRRVESEAVRMGLLVDDLLLLARLDAGRPLLSEPVDVTQLAIEAATDAHAAGPDHRWVLDLPAEPVVVLGDPYRLHQVLVNLLANARMHTPAGTTVTIGVSQPRGEDPDTVVITVADDGPGIPQVLQPTLFERFSRGDGARTRSGGAAGGGEDAGGTGLGLAIVRAVVEAHGGRISVTSQPGRTVFRAALPITTATGGDQPQPLADQPR
jgi:two-component system OmpR family sensor kinase